MFTVLALLFAAIGLPLLAHGPKNRVTNVNRIGWLLTLISMVLWFCVIVGLIAQAVQWLWVHAP